MLAYPFLGDLPDSGIELGSPAFQADSLAGELPRKLSSLKILFYNKDRFKKAVRAKVKDKS